jgi:ubiquinone/menaquinone biosynthesis C-methylase UbiE
MNNMNERVFNQKAEKLRAPERIARLQVGYVAGLILSSGNIKSVIDIGTGSGVFAEAFYNKGVKVSGVDSNFEMIEAARNYLPECEFKTAPAEKLPYEDNSFDIAFMGLILHEADDHLLAVKEAYRTTRTAVWILEWYFKSEDFGPPLEHRLTPEFISDLSRKAGFKEVITIGMQNMVLYKLAK